jgi:hypothetical protein
MRPHRLILSSYSAHTQLILRQALILVHAAIPPQAETQKRKKAREAAAPKAKPLWEEDGKRRGLLDKCAAGCMVLGV